jgi:hypothetical protein
MMLAVRPLFDEVTSYTYRWLGEVIETVKPVIDLKGSEAVRERFVETVEKYDPSMIIHYDHGVEDGWIGNDTGKIVDLENVELLAGREIYTLNCLSARKLGVEAFKKGAKAYWGFVDVFAFTSEDEEYFKEFANNGLRLRLQGLPWEECLQKTLEKADELVNKLVSAGRIISAIALSHDKNSLVCYTVKNPPRSTCFLRRLAAKIFGLKAWRISRRQALGWMFFLVGYGVSLHDFTHQVYELKGTVISLEGGYVGFALIMAGFIAVTWDIVEWLKK